LDAGGVGGMKIEGIGGLSFPVGDKRASRFSCFAGKELEDATLSFFRAIMLALQVKQTLIVQLIVGSYPPIMSVQCTR
jgi:hypothetical protein